MLKTIVNHVKYKQRLVNTNIKVVMKNSMYAVEQIVNNILINPLLPASDNCGLQLAGFNYKPETILAGEGPPPPERGTGNADALLKSAAPKISNSKLKVIVFDMSVLVLHNPNDRSAAGVGFTSVGNWESWNIKQGTKGLLGYLHTRGIQAALLPRLDIRNDAKLVDKAVHALSDQMQYEFSHVAANDPPNLDKSKSKLVQNLEILRKHSFNSVDCNDMMIFSIDPDVLQEAKDANYLTCAFKLGGVNWKAARIASNHVNSMDEMKLIIEDYNGISFRNRSTFF